MSSDENFFYLVRLHALQHAEAADVDNTNLMTLTSTRIQVHQRHDVLGKLCVVCVGRDVHNLWNYFKRY